MKYLFPYKEVDAGSKIVMWGAGVVGREYYRQIKATNYCNIIDVIDSAASNELNGFIHSPDKIDLTADYYVIAILSEKAVAEIRNILLDKGIDAEKIIDSIIVVKNKYDDFSLEDIIKNNKWKEIAEDYMANSYGGFEYLAELGKEIKKFGNKTALIESFEKTVSDLTTPQAVVLLRCLLLNDCFNADLLKLYMGKLADVENKELVVFLLYEIVWREILHAEYLYDDYYIDRRNLIEKNTEAILKPYDINLNKRKYTNSDIKKILILRLNFPTYGKSSATKLAVDWANGLADRGIEVLLLSLNFLERFNTMSYININKTFETFEDNTQYINPSVLVEKCKGRSVTEKMKSVLERINEFNPDIILDTCADYEMLSSIIYKSYPLIQIPFRGTNSCTFHHKCIVSNKDLFHIQNKRFRSVKEENVAFAFRTGYRDETTKAISLAEKGSERKKRGLDNNFICVSASNRAERELAGEFTEMMIEILDLCPDMVWIIVGRGDFDEMKSKYNEYIETGRIMLWGFEKEIYTLYKRLDADVAIYPETTGNGTNASFPIMNGVPVLNMKCIGDGATIIGLDNMVEKEQFKETLVELYNDSGKLTELYSKEKQYRDENGGDIYNFIDTVLSCGKEIIEDKFMD